VKKLKEAIFEITKGEQDSESRNQEKAMKIFINFSLAMALKNYIQISELKGTDMSNRLLISQAILQEELSALVYEHSKLVKPYLLYLDLVRDSEPFTDVLSGLYEEILLEGKGGDGLGQFMTPSDLSKMLSKLIFNEEEVRAINSPKLISEPCCGAGALALSPLHRVWSIDPSKLKFMNLVLNDIDGLAVRAAVLQIVASLTIHSLEMGEIQVYCANLITEYMKPGKHFLSIVPAHIGSVKVNAFVKYERFANQVFSGIDTPKKDMAWALS
jgi:hypothetical protein